MFVFHGRSTQSSQKITHLLRLKPGKHRSFEESPDSSKAAIFPGFNRTSGDVGSLVKVPKGEVGPMVKDFCHKKNVQVLMCRIFFDSPFLLVSSFFLSATQKKPCKKLLKDSDTLQPTSLHSTRFTKCKVNDASTGEVSTAC